MHTVGEAVDFIEKIFGRSKQSNNGLNVSVCCPICKDFEKKKLVIQTTTFKNHCWVCGYKSKTLIGLLTTFHPEYLKPFIERFKDVLPVVSSEEELSLVEQVKAKLTSIDNTQQHSSVLFVPETFRLLAPVWYKQHPTTSIIGKTINYLISRGVKLEDAWLYKLGVVLKQGLDVSNRVVIPSYDSNGTLNYYTSRTINPFIKPKYVDVEFPKETIVFNEINIDWSKELTITEGPFDMFKCGENTTCLLGSNLETNWRLFQTIIQHNTPVLLALDNDAKHKTRKFARLFIEHGIETRVVYPPEGLNDFGALKNKEEFYNCIPKPVTQNSLLVERLKQ